VLRGVTTAAAQDREDPQLDVGAPDIEEPHLALRESGGEERRQSVRYESRVNPE
jgi:hypothetical protein